MKRTAILALISLGLVGLGLGLAFTHLTPQLAETKPPIAPPSVTIAELLSNPERYLNQTVRIAVKDISGFPSTPSVPINFQVSDGTGWIAVTWTCLESVPKAPFELVGVFYYGSVLFSGPSYLLVAVCPESPPIY